MPTPDWGAESAGREDWLTEETEFAGGGEDWTGTTVGVVVAAGVELAGREMTSVDGVDVAGAVAAVVVWVGWVLCLCDTGFFVACLARTWTVA